jgi:hypothetical protein
LTNGDPQLPVDSFDRIFPRPYVSW